MFTKIDLCSMALLKLGEKPIQSLQDDSVPAQLSRSLFDSTVDTLLCMFPWRFATQQITVNRNTDGNFVIPSNVLKVIKCDGKIIGNQIKTNGDITKITAIVRTEPELFPGYFATLVATKLALEFSIPLIGDTNIFQMMMALYNSEYQSAKFIDSTTSNQSGIDSFALIDSRF